MRREQARKEAQEIANRDRLVMVVAFNPYEEFAESEEDKYGFYPEGAASIFHLEEVVETIRPE